jgi:hypothetical protein
MDMDEKCVLARKIAASIASGDRKRIDSEFGEGSYDMLDNVFVYNKLKHDKNKVAISLRAALKKIIIDFGWNNSV